MVIRCKNPKWDGGFTGHMHKKKHILKHKVGDESLKSYNLKNMFVSEGILIKQLWL
jgi:hypothetical protein